MRRYELVAAINRGERCGERVPNPRYPLYTDRPVRLCGRKMPCKAHAKPRRDRKAE